MFREMGLVMPALFVSAVNSVIGTPQSSPRVLIIYYSLGDNSLVSVARTIQVATGGDIYELGGGYPFPNPMEYDIVFVGTPIWSANDSQPLKSFLAHTDLSGCIVIPFVSRTNSGRSFNEIANLCTGCIVDTDGWSGRRGHQRGLDKWVHRKLMLYN